MPENQEKIPRSRINKRNPDFKPNPPTNPERPEMADDGRKIEISQPNSGTTPASDGHIQWPEMAGNGREIEISELIFRQRAALPKIALAQSLAQAARDTGVAERTLRRWLENPSFREELDHLIRNAIGKQTLG